MPKIAAATVAENRELRRDALLSAAATLMQRGGSFTVAEVAKEVGLSIINGVCPGDWKGAKVMLGDAINEPVDLDVDPTALDMAASDAWVDMVDELGCDCTKLGGYPLWTNEPLDIDRVMKAPHSFHHRIAGDLIDLKLGDGGVVYVFVSEDGTGGALCWQQAS